MSRRALAGGLALIAAVIAGVALVPDLRADPDGAPPAVLNRIAQKNDRATVEAAAHMRVQSHVTTEAAESMRAAQERGRNEADAILARFDGNETAAN
jgi:hypothetical protein